MRSAKQDFELSLAPPTPGAPAPPPLRLFKGDRVIIVPAHHRDAAVFLEPERFVHGTEGLNHFRRIALYYQSFTQIALSVGRLGSLHRNEAAETLSGRLEGARVCALGKPHCGKCARSGRKRVASCYCRRALAIAEVRVFLAALVTRVDLEAVEGGAVPPPPPADLKRAGLGVVPPKSPMMVRVRPRRPAQSHQA